MSKCWRLAMILAALIFQAPAANAAWYAAPITRIQLNSAGHISLFLDGANHECGSTRVDFIADNDAPGRSILAALLTWQAQGRTVYFYIANCSGTSGIFTDIYNAT